MIGIKPEVIQCPKADCIGIGVLRKRFAVPGYRIRRLSYSPGRAAETQVHECAVVCPAGFLRRRVKADVTYVNSRRQRHAKGLNSAIQVLVIQGIFIMPDSWTWVSHFITHEPDAIVPRIRLDLMY